MPDEMIHPNRFADRVVVVTGGVSGIGRAVARRAAAEGACVIVVDRNASLWPETRDELGQSEAHFVAADLTDLASIATGAREIAALTPRVDVLVNSAGVVHIGGQQDNPFAERGLEGWDLLMDVNLRAPAALVHELRDLLVAAGGSIVNISSEGQFGARDTRWIYDATKAGILSVTRSLAAALAPYGVRVNAVAPGGTLTEMHLNDVRGDADAIRRLTEMKLPNLLQRFATSEEIAAVILFLASDDASFITGATIPVDGGGKGM
jgi:NAD(P)-dependent dehydrogenase (short-subunit alcohol dehydrogenase family)